VLPLYVDGGAGSSTSSGGGGGGGVRPAGAGSSSAARGHGVGGGGGAWALSRADSLGSSPSPGGVSTAAATAAAVAYAGAAAAAAAFGRAAGLDAAVIPAAVSGAATGAAAMTQVPGARRSEPGDFKTAWELLQRSLACFLRDKAATTGMQLPAAWPPLAWLAVLCAAVKRDGRPDGKLVAASNAADQQPTDVYQAQQALDSSSFGGRGGGGSALDASDGARTTRQQQQHPCACVPMRETGNPYACPCAICATLTILLLLLPAPRVCAATQPSTCLTKTSGRTRAAGGLSRARSRHRHLSLMPWSTGRVPCTQMATPWQEVRHQLRPLLRTLQLQLALGCRRWAPRLAAE
jgi:hypothetical protein